MDVIRYNIRCDEHIIKRAVYIVFSIDMNGHKDVLGMYVGKNESAKYCFSIINGLKKRVLEDYSNTLVLTKVSAVSHKLLK